MKPKTLEAKALLEEATKRIFSLGPRDLASALAYENMRYGLGKMMHALDDLDVCCVFGPDATITRNIERWNSGFGYGAVIKWPEKGVMFPEIRPNACGMLLAEIDNMPSREEIISRIAEVENDDLYLDDLKLQPDFGHGNHFFEFYSVLESSPDIEKEMPKEKHYVLLHGSAPEKKNILKEAGEGKEVKTPLGKTKMLEGSEAKEYRRRWDELDDFSRRRREFLLEKMIGKFKVVSNLTHQGLFGRNEVRLGCYDTMQASGNGKQTLFPVALRWDIPVYVFKGKKNLSGEVVHRTGFSQKAEEVGLGEELKGINILPHGGGYKVDIEYTKISIVNTEFGNHFVLKGAKPASKVSDVVGDSKKGVSEFGEMVIMSPRELPYDYRGLAVIQRTLEYDLGDPVAKLQPLMTLKI